MIKLIYLNAVVSVLATGMRKLSYTIREKITGDKNITSQKKKKVAE